MCLYLDSLDKLETKDKFPISFIDDVMDEIYDSYLFTRLDLHSSFQ
jgi:hypothetical protein